MNEVGKTFRKLICNYENAHTSVRRHRFNFFCFSPSERRQEAHTGKGVACDLKITCSFISGAFEGKTFSEMEKFRVEILKHTNDFVFLITFFSENHKNVLRALFSLPGKL